MKVKKGMFDAFTPFDLTIRVETPEEQAGLYNIFNHVFIIASAGITSGAELITDKLEHDQRFPFEEFDTGLVKRFKNKGAL